MLTNESKLQIRTILIGLMVLISVFEIKTPFHFLILNTFLAYIPIELGFTLKKIKSQKSNLFWPVLIIWALFYPNAPYVLTDLFHLSLLKPYNTSRLIKLSFPLWTNYTFLVISALAFFILGLVNLLQIAKEITSKVKAKQVAFIKPIISFLLMLLASIGVFIGRFLRIHSVYLLISPHLFIRPIANMWNLRMAGFVILMTGIQLFVWWLIKIIRN